MLKGLTLSTLMLVCLAATTLSKSPQKPMAELVGEVIMNGDLVRINRAPAQRGSTVFNGNEIQTENTSAFVHLTSGRGVLSVGPGAQVRISLVQAKIIAEVFRGSITVRTALASTVIAPDRVVNSEPDNLYTVSVSDSGTMVESLLKPVAVKAADGGVEIITPQVTKAVATAGPLRDFSRPSPSERRVMGETESCFVSATCRRTDNTLIVSGQVLCTVNPVTGTRVTLRCYFQKKKGNALLATRTDHSGKYEFAMTDPRVSVGGMTHIIVEDCGQCNGGMKTMSNRCFF
jgi:hypothetical protein